MKRRVLTALVAIPVVLGVVGCTNPWPLGVLLLLAGAVCYFESEHFYSEEGGIDGASFFGLLCLLGANAFLHFQGGTGNLLPRVVESAWLLLAGAALWLLGVFASWRRVRGEKSAVLRFLSSFWFAVPLLALFELHPAITDWQWHLPNALLIALLPIWAGDTAAMLGGKAFGKHKMAPSISPNKTWEGAIANFLASLVVGWGVGVWLGYEVWVGLACGAAVGVFGQLGDLFESALKRGAGKKDSGTILPGHGGVLDRIDALLGAAVPVWLILWLSGSI